MELIKKLLSRLKKSELATNASIYGTFNVANGLAPLLLVPYLSRKLSPESFGKAQMFLLLVGGIGALADFSIPSAVQRASFDKGKNIKEYLGGGLALSALTTTSAVCMLLIFGKHLESALSISVTWMVIAVLLAFAKGVIQTRCALWQAAGKAGAFGAMNSALLALSLLMVFFYVGLIGLDWKGRVVAEVSAVSVIASGSLFLIWREPGISFARLKYGFNDCLRFGKGLLLYRLGGQTFYLTDRILLAGMVGIAFVGVYSAAKTIAMVMVIMVASFDLAWKPWVFKQLSERGESGGRLVAKVALMYVPAILLVGLVFWALYPIVADVMLGEKFTAAQELIPWLIAGYALDGCYRTVTVFLWYEKKTSALGIGALMAALAGVPIYIFCIKHWGGEGAAKGMLIGYAVYLISGILISFRKSEECRRAFSSVLIGGRSGG